MVYQVNKSLWDDNCFSFKTETGTDYICSMMRTAPESNLWTFQFNSSKEDFDNREIFTVMNTIEKYILELTELRDIDKVVVYIQGKNRQEIDKKTKIFTRWIKDPWSVKVVDSRELPIAQRFDFNTNIILMTKNIKENSINQISMKFCFNCGSENKDYKFCPNCGTNLQQA